MNLFILTCFALESSDSFCWFHLEVSVDNDFVVVVDFLEHCDDPERSAFSFCLPYSYFTGPTYINTKLSMIYFLRETKLAYLKFVEEENQHELYLAPYSCSSSPVINDDLIRPTIATRLLSDTVFSAMYSIAFVDFILFSHCFMFVSRAETCGVWWLCLSMGYISWKILVTARNTTTR